MTKEKLIEKYSKLVERRRNRITEGVRGDFIDALQSQLEVDEMILAALKNTNIINCWNCILKDTEDCPATFEEGLGEDCVGIYKTFNDIAFCSYGIRR